MKSFHIFVFVYVCVVLATECTYICVLRVTEERRAAYGEEEIKKFLSERKKKLLSPHEVGSLKCDCT